MSLRVKEGPESKARLIATMRPFFKRRTWGSTLFGLPIVTMHGLKEEDVEVEFCQAERILYDTLVRTYRERINGKFNYLFVCMKPLV